MLDLSKIQGGFRSALVCAACLVTGPVLLAACAEDSKPPPKNADDYRASAKQAYDEAVEAYLDSNWLYAEQLFEDIRHDYGYSRYARLAELRLADAAFRQDKFAEAVSGYRGFVHDYPNDPEIPYARYRITRAHFLQSDTSFLAPPLEERDLINVTEAHTSIRSFLSDYPGYKRGAELAYMLQVVTGLLVRHELYVARFYLNLDEFDAAIKRVQYSLRTYEDSGLEPEAIVLLGETYLKMKNDAKAKASFQHVLAKYPDSPFTIPARNFLQFLDARGPAGSNAEVPATAPARPN